MRSLFSAFVSTGRHGRARRGDRSVGAGTHGRACWIGRREVSVQDLRIKSESIRPNHASGLGIDAHQLEELRVAERLEHLAPEIVRQVDFSIRAVAEYDMQPIVRKGLSLGYAEHHQISLRQRVNGVQRVVTSRLLPSILQVRPMQFQPLAHKPEGTRWKESVEQSPISNRQLRPVPAELGVEVGREMVAPIHPDDDPVELRDPRHGSAQPCARGFLALRGLGPGGPTRRAASSNASRSTYVSLSRGRLYVRSNPRSIQRQIADRERPMILAASTVVTSRSSGGRGTAGGYGIAGLECHNPPSTIIAITGLKSYNRPKREDRRQMPGKRATVPRIQPVAKEDPS